MLGSYCESSILREALVKVFRHPKYYEEMRRRARKLQQEEKLKQQAERNKHEKEASSDKQQAAEDSDQDSS